MTSRTPAALMLVLAACGGGVAPGLTGGNLGSDGGALPDLAAQAPPVPDLALRAPDLTPPGDMAKPRSQLVIDRPYKVHVPASYDPNQPAPLLVMLHGYASDAAGHERYFHFVPLSDAHGFLYAYPDGTRDLIGQRFWNATDACCNLFASKVDDVAYLTAVIDDLRARYHVDDKRIFLVGHSNGGFMSHRLACERADRVAAFVSLAGHGYQDPAKCQAAAPVAVLQIHGDNDETINYNGGSNGLLQPYPSAKDSVAGWAARNRCKSTPDNSSPAVDIDAKLAGSETTVAKYPDCQASAAAELWTIRGGRHEPPLSAGFGELVWGFLSAHPKP